MLIIKDSGSLDTKFPFSINEYTLKREDNNEDSYHYHDFCEVTYVMSGRGKYNVSGNVYEMKSGDIIIFNNVEPHGWIVEDQKMQVLVMTFAPELVSDPGNVFSSDFIRPFVSRGAGFRNRIEAEDEYTKTIHSILLEIYDEYKNKDKGYMNMIQADILRILTYLIRHYRLDDNTLDEIRKSVKRIEPALLYINAHYTQTIRLEEVADIVYMSPNYFSSFFRKVTGRPFGEYITHLRLKKVQELYKTTDKSMAELAMECGFHNVSNFYRLYKKYVGELPVRIKQDK